VFSAHCAVEIYAEVFDKAGHLDRLEGFSSFHGADHYGIPRNTETMTLEKKSWTVPISYQFGATTVTPLRMGEEVEWTIVS
jgi:dihydroorotase